jgi:Putative beta barrel porin-7 (BBP7)
MKKGFFGCAGLLVAGVSLAWAEPPTERTRPQLGLSINEATATRPAQIPPAGSAPAAEVLNAPSACGADCGADHEPCGPPGRFWVSGEYLLWWLRGGSTPPLVTTGPVTGAGLPGVVGAPGTVVLFGGDRDDDHPHSGFRVTAGMWLDDCHTHGIEFRYFELFPRSEDFNAGSPSVPVIGRPFVDVTGGLPGVGDVEFAAFPGLATGSIHIHQDTRLRGAEANYICNLCCCCERRFDVFAGFRYLELRDHLDIDEDVLVGPNAPAFAGSRILVSDHFATRNTFYGGQVGASAEFWRDRWFVNGRASIALGSTHQVVDIAGSTTIIAPSGATTVEQGGLLALSSNIGHYHRDRFSWAPELGFNVGRQITDNLRVFVGYNFLYWSNVVRAGEQIDPVLNRHLIPTSSTFGTPGGPARPAFSFHDSDIWAHGINIGVELRF